MGKYFGYKRQEKSRETKQAFAKVKSVYGKHMEDAPLNGQSENVRTNFDELIEMRNSRSERFQKGYARFFFLLVLGLIIFIIVNFSILSDKLV